LKTYLDWVSEILQAKDKLKQFKKLLKFPLKTNKVVDKIADEYKKLFHAQNSLKQYQFKNSDLVQDFQAYLDSIGEKDFFESKVFSAMLTAINSIVVIDMDAEPSFEPNPYPLIVDIESVVDCVTTKRDATFEYLIYRDVNDSIIAIDDEYYRRYEKVINSDEYYLSVENPHDLGYTPAKYMWDDALDNSNLDIKHSPIASILEDLDWYLFFETGKKNLDIYAPFPIYWSYKSRLCNFRNEEGNECTSGYHILGGKREECPACAKSKNLNGPGSFVTVPMPQSKEQPDLREPIGVVPADTDSLSYNVDEVKRLKAEIIETATGKIDASLLSKEAINEDQVKSQFEAQTNVLTYLAENFEKIHTWVIDTIGKLKYGDLYIGCSINYGSEFYLKTLSEVTKDYKDAKSSGLPNYILLSKKSLIEELQGKDNPSEKERMHVLKYLEPYPDYTIQELNSLGIKEIDFEGFVLKVNFATLVAEFELEYGSLTEFGSLIEFKTKIERIKTILNGYVKRFKKPEPEPAGEPNG
jgi:hypothetical protein